MKHRVWSITVVLVLLLSAFGFLQTGRTASSEISPSSRCVCTPFCRACSSLGGSRNAGALGRAESFRGCASIRGKRLVSAFSSSSSMAVPRSMARHSAVTPTFRGRCGRFVPKCWFSVEAADTNVMFSSVSTVGKCRPSMAFPGAFDRETDGAMWKTMRQRELFCGKPVGIVEN